MTDSWENPSYFQEYLSHMGMVGGIYKAMKKEDLAEVVMAALEVLKETYIKEPTKTEKSEEKSNEHRIKGNHALADKKFQIALVMYNIALLFAPKDSRAMKLAYSNRSAIYFKFELYTASLKDVETCFSLGCPEDIVTKLKKRKQDCTTRLWGEKLTEGFFSSTYADDYFALNVPRNPQIPCATTAVGVIMESNVPKVVAVKDITVGTVVAVETAFVSESHKMNHYFSCYFCEKMALNLFPCETCCWALFCSQQCQSQCIEEYHGSECHIIDLMKSMPTQSVTLATKAVLKMKNMSKSWEEFITESKVAGRNRIKISSVNEVYDLKNKASLICYDDEKFYKYGRMYNYSFGCATVLYHLAKIPGFLPKKTEEKQQAMKALARTLMGLCLYTPQTRLLEAVQNGEKSTLGIHQGVNVGWFAFIGKLSHCCNANLLIIGLNKKAALVALKPIKQGEELTVSYLLHWIENHPPSRARSLYCDFSILCDCEVCKEDWDGTFFDDSEFTDAQKLTLKKLKIRELKVELNHPSASEKFEKRICNALSVLSDSPNTEEYYDVFMLYKRCIYDYQLATTKNIVLGDLI